MNRNIQSILTDSKSISKKSAKTIKNIGIKKVDNEPYQFVPIYFAPNKLIQRIEQRALQKTKDKSAKKVKEDHLDKANQLLDSLFQKLQFKKQKIHHLNHQVQRKNQDESPFKPKKPKKQKYIVKGDIIRRNQIWLQQKKKRQVDRKQNQLMEDLQVCTFSPDIVSRQESSIYLKNRDNSATLKDKSQIYISRKENKKQMSMSQYETQKKKIYNRLNTIVV